MKSSRPWCIDFSPDGQSYCVGTEEGEIWTVLLPPANAPPDMAGSPACVIHTHNTAVRCWYGDVLFARHCMHVAPSR